MRHLARRSRGFSLVELLVAMVVLGVLFTVVATAISGLIRTDRKSRDQADQLRARQRFTTQFRQDVHAANTGSILSDENSPASDDDATDQSANQQPLILAYDDDRTIRFQPTEKGMQRIVSRGSVKLHRESYVWEPRAKTSWHMDTTQDLAIVTLHINVAGRPDRAEHNHVVRATLLNSQPIKQDEGS